MNHTKTELFHLSVVRVFLFRHTCWDFLCCRKCLPWGHLMSRFALGRAGALATTGYVIFWSGLLGHWNVTFWPLVERVSAIRLQILFWWSQMEKIGPIQVCCDLLGQSLMLEVDDFITKFFGEDSERLAQGILSRKDTQALYFVSNDNNWCLNNIHMQYYYKVQIFKT